MLSEGSERAWISYEDSEFGLSTVLYVGTVSKPSERHNLAVEAIDASKSPDANAKDRLAPALPDLFGLDPRGQAKRVPLKPVEDLIEVQLRRARQATELSGRLIGELDVGHRPRLEPATTAELAEADMRAYLGSVHHLLQELLRDVLLDEIEEDVIPRHIAAFEGPKHSERRRVDA